MCKHMPLMRDFSYVEQMIHLKLLSADFEKESGSKVFYNLPYLDDKLDNQPIINAFLSALGFSRIDPNGSGIFSIFK